MKSLKEYTSDELLIDEGLSNLLKGFWSWLIGRNSKYDPSSDLYDEKEKVKYINTYSSSDIKVKIVDNYKLLKKIISKSLSKTDKKVGFFKIENFLKDYPEYKELNEENKFFAFILETDKFTDCCALFGFNTNDKEIDGRPVIYISEILPIYKYLIKPTHIKDELNNIQENIVINDSYLLGLFKANKIKLTKIESKNNTYYIL